MAGSASPLPRAKLSIEELTAMRSEFATLNPPRRERYARDIFASLQSHIPTERYDTCLDEVDETLEAHLLTLIDLHSPITPPSLPDFLRDDCLLATPQGDKHGAWCKSIRTQAAAMVLLREAEGRRIGREGVDLEVEELSRGYARLARFRKKGELVGLVDFGCTDTTNALLQCLLPILPPPLLTHPSPSPFLAEFQSTIAHMVHSTVATYAPRALFRVWDVGAGPGGGEGGEGRNVGVPQDVVEEWLQLTSLLEAENDGVKELLDAWFGVGIEQWIEWEGGSSPRRRELTFGINLRVGDGGELLTLVGDALSADEIEGYAIPGTEERTTATVRRALAGPFPKVLVFQIARCVFDFETFAQRFNPNPINVTQSVSLSEVSGGGTEEWALVAAIVHVGAAMAGHSYAVVKKGEEWVIADDTHTSLTKTWEEIQPTLSTNSTILFYSALPPTHEYLPTIPPSLIDKVRHDEGELVWEKRREVLQSRIQRQDGGGE